MNQEQQEQTQDVNADAIADDTLPAEGEPVTQADAPVMEGGDVETQLATLSKERDEYLDQWRRSVAEFQNFRKREDRLRLERERGESQRVIKKLLPVLDDLHRGAQHVPEELQTSEWANGMLAIERKLWAVLEQEGVSLIDAAPGTTFDPNHHEALLSQEHEEYSEGQIVAELERGYKHRDMILRPARVSVAR